MARRAFWRDHRARNGVTIIVTTHFMEEAEYCDRIARTVACWRSAPQQVREQAGGDRAMDMNSAFIANVEQSRAALARKGEQRDTPHVRLSHAAHCPDPRKHGRCCATAATSVVDLLAACRADPSCSAYVSFDVAMRLSPWFWRTGPRPRECGRGSFRIALSRAGAGLDVGRAVARCARLRVVPSFGRRCTREPWRSGSESLLNGYERDHGDDYRHLYRRRDPDFRCHDQIARPGVDRAAAHSALSSGSGSMPPAAAPGIWCPACWYRRHHPDRAFLTSLLIAREWERGTLESLFVTPVRPLELVMAKLAPYMVIGAIDVALCLASARFLFHVPIRGSLGVIVVSSLLYLSVSLMLGLLISGVTRNQFAASQMAMLASFMPATMLSGFV
jgi:hypothetical protein